MNRARSVDLREQALSALAEGLSRRDVCQVFGIHRNTLGRWHKRGATGSLESRHGGGNPRKIKPEHEAALLHQLQAAPDATLEEHAARSKEEQGQPVSRSAMDRAIVRLNWTRKKRA
jgi:transposase